MSVTGDNLYDEEDFDREPTEAELDAIEAEYSGTFDDPDWDADKEVDLNYPGAEYDYDGDPYDNEYDVP